MQNRNLSSRQNAARSKNVTTWALPPGSVARLGQGCVNDIAFSPDSNRVAVGTPIGLWLYELSTVSPIALWHTGQERISAISFSPNGKWIATGNRDGGVKVWELQTGRCITQMKRRSDQKHLPRQNEISRLVFSPDNQQLAVSGRHDYIVDVWCPKTGEHLAKINGDSQIELRYCSPTKPLVFSPDSRLLVCVSADDTKGSTAPERDFLAVWDVSSRERVACLTEYTDVVYSLCFSPCGCFLAAGGDVNGTLTVWDVGNWHVHRGIPDYAGYRLIPSYSAEGFLRIAEISPSAITLWDVEHGEKLHTYRTPGEITDAQFFQGMQLATNSGLELKVWTLENRQPLTTVRTHVSFPESLVFSSDGKTLACAYRYDGILLWNVVTPSQRPSVFNPSGREHRVYAPSNGKIQATTEDGDTIKVWEVGDATSVAQITPEKPPTYWAVAFSPQTQLLACGDDAGTVTVWDIAREEKRYTFTKHSATMVTLMFSPNGKFLVSFDEGFNARLWDVGHGEEILDFPGNRIETVAFSFCSRLIVADTQKEILVWDTTHRETCLTIRKPEEWIDNGLWQMAFAFSRCGRYFASGSGWNLGMEKVPVRLWDLTGQNIATFWGHTREIQALAFSPDGALLASGSYDGTILLWDVKPYLQNETP